MSTAYKYDTPRFYSNTQWKEPKRNSAPTGTNQTFDAGQFVFLDSTGTMYLATTSPASVAGLSDTAAQAEYTGTGGYTALFGPGSPGAGSQVQPYAPGAVGHYISADNGQPFEISLRESWVGTGPSAMNGTAIGLAIDATTGIWVATTSGQKIGTILQGLAVDGSYAFASGPGGSNIYASQPMGFVSGDTGTRVVISLSAASVSP